MLETPSSLEPLLTKAPQEAREGWDFGLGWVVYSFEGGEERDGWMDLSDETKRRRDGERERALRLLV